VVPASVDVTGERRVEMLDIATLHLGACIYLVAAAAWLAIDPARRVELGSDV